MAKSLLSLILSILLTLNVRASGSRCEAVFTGSEQLIFGIDIEKQDPEVFMLTSYYDLMNKGQLEESAQLIKHIAKKGLRDLSHKDIATLKGTRKYATILRSAWQLSHKNHESPKRFERFVKDFGHLNDFIAAGKTKEAQAEAQLVKKDLKNLDIDKFETLMNPATQKSTRTYLKVLRKEAREILEKETLSLEKYHAVRKILKEFMTYYYLKAEISNAAPGQEYQFLFQLNEELGLLNDQFTTQILNGLANKKKTKIAFPAELKHKVEYFLNSLVM